MTRAQRWIVRAIAVAFVVIVMVIILGAGLDLWGIVDDRFHDKE